MKAAVYIRVSTDEQAKEGYSIGAQQDRITKFIESQGWEIVDFYIDDGYSAKDLERPAMQNLIKDVKAGKFTVVVFYKLDRLVRSVSDLHDLLQLFEEHDISIRSVSEIFDTTSAIGRLFITMVAAMAQWERETIAERVIEGMTKKASQGERNGGRAPFGYNLINGELVINEKEARIVREIFRMYLSGSGLREIVLRYNSLKKGPRDIRNVARLLDNPVYCGRLRWNKNSKREEVIHDGTHQPIIDVETFEQAQRAREKRRIDGKTSTSIFHFSGVLRCARCESAISGWYRRQKDVKQYICVSKKNKHTCDLPIFTEAALTSAFLDSINPDDPEKFFSLLQTEDQSPVVAEEYTFVIEELEKELSRIKKRKSNWLDALGDGIISKQDYKEKTEEDNKKELAINQQLEELNALLSPKINPQMVLEIAHKIPQLWEVLNDFEKKSFLSDLLKKIVVDVPRDLKQRKGPGTKIPVQITSVQLNDQ